MYIYIIHHHTLCIRIALMFKVQFQFITFCPGIIHLVVTAQHTHTKNDSLASLSSSLAVYVYVYVNCTCNAYTKCAALAGGWNKRTNRLLTKSIDT